LGFRDDIESIKSFLPRSPERQTLLFSATVSSAIRQVAISTLSSGYKYINCVSKDDSPVHDHVSQYHTVLEDSSQQFSHLIHLITHDQLSTGGKSKIIIFFSTTKAVQLFSRFIMQVAPQILPSGRKTKVYEMHAKRDMDKRMSVSRNFRKDTSGACILVTSDVSARGVDYPGVTRVIQMGVPASGDMYVHRVGRTGRGDNKTGRGDLVTSSWEMGFMKKQLRSMPLKPLSANDVQEQTRELAKSKDEKYGADLSGGDKDGVVGEFTRRLNEVESVCQTLTNRVGEEGAQEIFIAQLGFYLGRAGDMGLNKDEVVSGLQSRAQQFFGLAEPFVIPHGMKMRLGLLSNGGGGGSSSSHGRMDSSSPYRRSANARPPWEGRGSRSSASREWGGSGGRSGSSYGQRSGGGYGASSSYGGSRDSSYPSRAPSPPKYGSSRDSFFTSRGSSDSAFGSNSKYGSRDDNSYIGSIPADMDGS
jgi:ATP-dependent RNA helicase MSS116, mitochondrial